MTTLTRLSSFAILTTLLSVPGWGAKTTRGGSDYGGGGAPGIPPGPCLGGNTSTFGDVTVVCGFSGGFGSSQVNDTIFHFELMNSSTSAAVTSATILFAPGAVPTDFGIVECGDPNNPNSLINLNPMAPCTALNSPINFSASTDASGNLLVSATGTAVLTFSNFTGSQAGTALNSGITVFFDVPDSTTSQATVTDVTSATGAVPEPSSFTLVMISALGSAVLLYRKRRSRG